MLGELFSDPLSLFENPERDVKLLSDAVFSGCEFCFTYGNKAKIGRNENSHLIFIPGPDLVYLPRPKRQLSKEEIIQLGRSWMPSGVNRGNIV